MHHMCKCYSFLDGAEDMVTLIVMTIAVGCTYREELYANSSGCINILAGHEY